MPFWLCLMLINLAEAAPPKIPKPDRQCGPSYTALLSPKSNFKEAYLDSLISATKRLDNFIAFDPGFLPAWIQASSHANVEKELLAALNSTDAKKRTFASSYAFRGKLFPLDYYFRSTHETSGWGIRPNAPKGPAVRRRMPYLEYTKGGWVEHAAGGSEEILRTLVQDGKPLKLYRGTFKYEAVIWEKLKDLRAAGKEKFDKASLRELNNMIDKPHRSGKRDTIPEEFRQGWRKIRNGLEGGTNEAAVKKVMTAWRAGYGSTFVTPDRDAALYFAPRDPGLGAILEFTVDPSRLLNEGIKDTYAGFENYYMEIAFGTPSSRNMLLDSFEGHVLEQLPLKPSR